MVANDRGSVCLLLFVHIYDKDSRIEFQIIHPTVNDKMDNSTQFNVCLNVDNGSQTKTFQIPPTGKNTAD